MRLLLDHHDLEPSTELACYRASLRWAAERGDRFVLTLDPQVYDPPSQLAELLALGHVRGDKQEHPTGVLTRLLPRFFRSEELVHIDGTPDQRFLKTLTEMPVPPKVIAGDLCPVFGVDVLRGDRRLYALLEYGRDQMFDLDDDERTEIERHLQDVSGVPIRLIPAPQLLA